MCAARINSFCTLGLLVLASGLTTALHAGGGPPRSDFGGTSKDFILFQDQAHVPGDGSVLNFFGYALATCDFNGDGFEDLAVGIPGEQMSGAAGAGRVVALYGSAVGPVGQIFAQSFQQGLLLPGVPGVNDNFGVSLAAADFNGDGLCDLAIGIPGDQVDGVGSGSVQVLYSDPGLGVLGVAGNQLLNLDAPGVAGLPAAGDRYGAALVAGDLDGDGLADLAVGVPGRVVDGLDDAGAVNVFYAVAGVGLQTTAPGDQWLNRTTVGNFPAQEGERFGAALALGTFDPTAGPALAIGSPNADIAPFTNVGWVHIVDGGAGGLDPSSSIYVNANYPSLPGQIATDDRFGLALVAGDFDGDGIDDLAIGVPGRADGATANAGEVLVAWGVSGFAGGFDGAALRSLGMGHNNSPAQLGWSLAARDTNGDGRAELAAGSPGRIVDGEAGAGAIDVFALPGRVGSRIAWVHQNTNTPLTGVAFANSAAGFAVGFGDFDGDGIGDLVSGSPGAHIHDDPGAGSVVVFAARGLFEDGFETGGLDQWSAAVP